MESIFFTTWYDEFPEFAADEFDEAAEMIIRKELQQKLFNFFPPLHNRDDPRFGMASVLKNVIINIKLLATIILARSGESLYSFIKDMPVELTLKL